MYTIYLDGELFYDPRIPSLAILEPVCETEVNKTGSMKFTVPAAHPLLSSIRKMYSEFALYQDDEWLFSGRVLSDGDDFYNNRTLELEGELSYLLDSIQRYHEYHDISVADYFSTLIQNHNADVDARKQFTVGNVTVTDPNDSLYRYSTYEDTWKTISDRLLSRLGGYIVVRHGPGTPGHPGTRYIDYIADFEDVGRVNTQVIRFGENILDLVKEGTAEDFATVIVPLGQKLEDSEERLTIASVNGGKDYIEDPDAVALYGRIVKTVEYDDVTLPENLLSRGREVLDSQKVLRTSVTVTAVDLHLMDVDIERCRTGDRIRVVSEPHGIDGYMDILKMSIDLQHPENSKMTLGATQLTLSSAMGRGTAAVLTSLRENFTAFHHVVTDRLQATNAEIEAVHSRLTETEQLVAQKASITDLNATNADVANLQAANAEVERLVAEKAGIADLRATEADIRELKAASANIESLLAGNAGVGTLQAIHLTGDNIVIDDATIAQAVMDDLMAGRVTAKTIYTDYVKIASRDGALAIEGSTIQIRDANNTVRVQIGRDGNGNYSYYLWDASGNLIWTPEGIAAGGVPDGLIVDSMVANDAGIDGAKLNIRSVARELEDDGTLKLDASRVVMDDTTLEASYRTLTQRVSQDETDTAELRSDTEGLKSDTATLKTQTQTLQTEFREVQGKIEQKVWQSDITEAVTPLGSSITELSDQYSAQQQTINGITTEIGDIQSSMESKADGSSVQSLTARVNSVEETAGGFSRTVSEIRTEVNNTVREVVTYYAQNGSETVPPPDDDEGWSTTMPERIRGTYVWQKTVTTYATGNTRTSSPVCISGADGLDGEDGDAGEDATTLRVDSTRGLVFKNDWYDTELRVTVMHGARTILDLQTLREEYGGSAHLEWFWRKQADEDWHAMSAGDTHITEGGFVMRVTPDDVDEQILFQCDLVV